MFTMFPTVTPYTPTIPPTIRGRIIPLKGLYSEAIQVTLHTQRVGTGRANPKGSRVPVLRSYYTQSVWNDNTPQVGAHRQAPPYGPEHSEGSDPQGEHRSRKRLTTSPGEGFSCLLSGHLYTPWLDRAVVMPYV